MNRQETRQRLIESGIAAERLPLDGQFDLSEADLSWADLSRAVGPFTVGAFGRHTAIAAGGYIVIGCERHDYDWWLANYEACGQCNGYTPEEIADYGAWIALAVARQRRIEQPETVA